MDLEDLERKMSKNQTIMGVHWGGYPLDLDEIRNIREDLEKNMDGNILIEDGSNSIGTKYKGKYLGNHNNFVMNSLQKLNISHQ